MMYQLGAKNIQIFFIRQAGYPLMILMTVTVAFGTIVESRYNTTWQGFWVYQTSWFQILLGLLWMNILCATLFSLSF